MGTLTAQPKDVRADAGRLISTDPMTLEVVGEVEVRDAEWVAAAVEKARRAQPAWAAKSVKERLAALERVKRLIMDAADEIADLIARETGKTHAGAMAADVGPSVDVFAYYSRTAPKALAREALELRHWGLMRRRSYLVSRPIGLIGVISPWNFPFLLSLQSVIPALVAGNAVILKPSEVTPLTGEKVGDLFRRAGFPDGLLTVASGAGATGQAVAERVDKIAFIGSDRTARRVLAAAAPRLTPCVMELGGNAPALVLRDADLDNAARGLCWAAFFNAGQICASAQRIYIDRSIYDRFTERFLEETRRLRMTDDRRHTDVGALTCEMQRTVVEDLVRDAKKGGAEVLCGGARPKELKGLFYQPTVLTRVEQSNRFAQDEVFGPVCMVMPFDSEEEAVRLANDTRYGLTASVWSRDVRRASRLAERIEAGSVTVNDHAVTAGITDVPWGGEKGSGFGVLNSRYGLYEFCHRRHIHVNALPGFPMPWWFPETPSTGVGMKNLMEGLAGDGLVERLRGVRGAVKAFWGW